jgi:hypothetical protein
MDRNELHSRIILIKQELEAGRLKFREGLAVIDSLQRVRFAPDGLVDPDSVDGLVRALALSVAFTASRREAKKIPLKQSQVEYFEILEKFFGKPFREMKKHDVSAAEIAAHLASSPAAVKAFEAEAGEFVAGLKDFWIFFAPTVEAHLQDLKAMKSVFGGDIFPSYANNIATSVGLYVDTLILPDPLVRLSDFVGYMKPDELLRLMTKHALSALQYKDLALADLDPPIVVIAPDPSFLEQSYREVLQLAGQTDTIVHCEKLFGRSFADNESLTSFLGKISDTSELVEQLSDQSKLLFDTEWSDPIEKQVERYASEVVGNLGPALEKLPTGKLVEFSVIGRMMQVNDLLIKSDRFRGNPLIDAPTSWQYLLWKYEYDAATRPQPREEVRDVLISRVISIEGSAKLGLLSGLPAQALIDLRKAGAMSDLREVIRRGIEGVDSASQSSLADVGDAVVTNICQAFAKHRKELEELASGRRKFYGFDVSRWVTFGAISIGAASTGNLALAVLAASAGVIGAPRIDELWKTYKELDSRRKELRRSATGLLFEHLHKH